MSENTSKIAATQHSWPRDVVSAVTVCISTAIVLHQMGRVWWCSCGSVVPWSWDIWSSHNSQHAVDPYTFSHVLHGVLFCGALYLCRRLVPWRHAFLIALILESGWEILENSPIIIERYRAVTISLDYFGDSIINSLSDIVACAVGFKLAERMGLIRSVIFFIAVELLMVALIRDNLILNVIMLVCPIDAIRQWQS